MIFVMCVFVVVMCSGTNGASDRGGGAEVGRICLVFFGEINL